MRIHSILLAGAVFSAAHVAFAQEAPKPLKLIGGVSENHMVTPDEVRDDAAKARAQAELQRAKDIKTFLENPRVYRVNKVDPVAKGSSMQHIMANAIAQVKVSQGGDVDLGEIQEGSGDHFEVPPGTLKVGDLFTIEQGQYVEVPKDHFKPLGGLAEVGRQQTGLSPGTVLMNAAKEMDKAATEFENNTLTAANHFGSGLAKWAGKTLEFLAQERGGFGRPGKPMQQLLDYLMNDYNENDQKLYEGAVQALEEFKKDPAMALGEHGPDLIPLGKLGKEAQMAKALEAAKRIDKMKKAVQEFGAFQKGVRQAKNAEQMAAQRAAQQRAQQDAQRAAQQRAQPPGRQRQQADAQRQQQQLEQQSAEAQRRQDAQRQAARGEERPPQQQPSEVDARRQQQQAQADAQRRQQDAQRQQARNQPRERQQQKQESGRDEAARRQQQQAQADAQRRQQAQADQRRQQQARAGQSGDTPQSQSPEPAPDPLKGDTAPMSSPEPMKGDTVPMTTADPMKGDTAPMASAPDPLKGDTVPAPETPAVTPAAPTTPPLGEQFQAALKQDTAFAGNAVSPTALVPDQKPDDDIIRQLRDKFGTAAKDPFHGAPGLQMTRQGIPVETSEADLARALKLGGQNARGLVFAVYPDGSARIFNARNNKGITEISDPTKPSQTPDLSTTEKMWFYRTN